MTVRKYLAAAMAAGLEQDGPASDEVQLSRLAASTRKAMSSRSRWAMRRDDATPVQ